MERPDLLVRVLVAWVQGPSQAQSISGVAKREKWTPALMCLTSSDEIGLKRRRPPRSSQTGPEGARGARGGGDRARGEATGGFP